MNTVHDRSRELTTLEQRWRAGRPELVVLNGHPGFANTSRMLILEVTSKPARFIITSIDFPR